MIYIGIVEDEACDREVLEKYFADFRKEIGEGRNLSFFSSGESFLNSFSYGKYDLILMDIELGNRSGRKTSEYIRKIDSDVILVFRTNLAQYAIDGYKVKASDYIVKPISYWDFKTRRKNIVDSILSKNKEKVLISENDKKVVLFLKDIYYIEVKNHLLVYHTNKGEFRTYGSLKSVVNERPKNGFALCNSCFLVNLSYVESVEGYSCIVHGTDLLISHPKRKGFLDALSRFLGAS